MSEGIDIFEGDGINDNLLRYMVGEPDSGSSVTVAGIIQVPGNPAVTLTGSPVSIPAAPASGTIYYIIEANYLTGAVAVLQSTSATPAADPNNIILQTSSLTPGQTDLALVAETTPDPPVGSP